MIGNEYMKKKHYTEVNLFDISEDVFHETDTNDFSPWSDLSINRIIQSGTGFTHGKQRVYHLFTKYNFTNAEKAVFLKEEYGIGGKSWDFHNADEDHGMIESSSKGLSISVWRNKNEYFGYDNSKTIPWTEFSKKIELLIATNKYMSDEDMKEYRQMDENDILPEWLMKRYGLYKDCSNEVITMRYIVLTEDCMPIESTLFKTDAPSHVIHQIENALHDFIMENNGEPIPSFIDMVHEKGYECAYVDDILDLNDYLMEQPDTEVYTVRYNKREKPEWLDESEVLIDQDEEYILLHDQDENVNQLYTYDGTFITTVQEETSTIEDALNEYEYGIQQSDDLEF